MWTETICERSPHFPAPGAGKQTPVFRVSGGSRCFVSSFFLSHPTCSWSCRGAATGGDGQSLKCEYEGGTSLWQEELYSLKSLGWIPITFFLSLSSQHLAWDWDTVAGRTWLNKETKAQAFWQKDHGDPRNWKVLRRWQREKNLRKLS